ncbi:hypothetical protein [Pseudoalteromonas sp. S4389]|nr:hypothetical protein [Pseudoalteromonas sp. S4389]
MLKKYLLLGLLVASPFTGYAAESLPDPLLEERGIMALFPKSLNYLASL